LNRDIGDRDADNNAAEKTCQGFNAAAIGGRKQRFFEKKRAKNFWLHWARGGFTSTDKRK
jgi:hypothetical protein